MPIRLLVLCRRAVVLLPILGLLVALLGRMIVDVQTSLLTGQHRQRSSCRGGVTRRPATAEPLVEALDAGLEALHALLQVCDLVIPAGSDALGTEEVVEALAAIWARLDP